MTTRIPNLCRACIHYVPDDGTCDAFPRGVPDDILLLGGDHRTSLGVDNGVVFEPRSTPRAQLILQEWEQFNAALSPS